jgi:uncharacterized membrane protein HdeD (DUF308 family)
MSGARLMPPAPATAVKLWTAGFAAAAVIQGLFARRFALGTSWGYSKGWQREIAIWNLGTLTTVAALRRGIDADRSLIAGFAVLSALFGANHLDAALRSRRSLSNWLGASANGVALAVGLAALASERSSARG